MTEPIVTYNLFLTAFLVPLSVSVSYFAIKRQFTERDKKDEQIAQLLAEREELKQKSISDWRELFSATQCAIKERLDEVVASLNDKVPWDHCVERRKARDIEMKEIEQRLRMGGI